MLSSSVVRQGALDAGHLAALVVGAVVVDHVLVPHPPHLPPLVAGEDAAGKESVASF